MTEPGPLLWVAEDSDEDYEALERMLRRAAPDTRLERYTRGEQLIAALHGARPHGEWPALLVLDLNLPTVTGLETLAQIRADERLRMLPVVVLSGSRRQEDIDAAYAAGANAYVPSRSTRASSTCCCARCWTGGAARCRRHDRRSEGAA